MLRGRLNTVFSVTSNRYSCSCYYVTGSEPVDFLRISGFLHVTEGLHMSYVLWHAGHVRRHLSFGTRSSALSAGFPLQDHESSADCGDFTRVYVPWGRQSFPVWSTKWNQTLTLSAITLTIKHSQWEQFSHFYLVISCSRAPGGQEKLHSKTLVR